MASLSKSQREAQNEVYQLLKIASRIADTDGLVSIRDDINAVLHTIKWFAKQERAHHGL